MAKPHSRLIYIYILATLLIVSILLLLSSCGQNNPSNLSQVANLPTSRPAGINVIPFSLTSPPVNISVTMNASDSSSISIAWDNYPNATSYNVYYSNTGDFTNPTKITQASSPYIYNFAQLYTNYYFKITAMVNGEEKRIGGDIISFYHNGNRYNIVIPVKEAYAMLIKKQNNVPQGFVANNPTSEFPVGPLEINISAATQIQYYIHLNLLINTNSPQPDGSILIETSVGNIYLSSKYSHGATARFRMYYDPAFGIVTEYIDTTYDKFSITDTSITYLNNNPLPGLYTISVYGFGDYGQATLTPLLVKISGQAVKDLPIYQGLNFNRPGFTDYGTSFTLISSLKKQKQLKSIDLQPYDATIYVYPLTSASHQQQYQAIGIFDDGSKMNITGDVRWHIWDLPPIASISQGGIAFPIASSSGHYTAGLVTFDAASTTSSTNKIISNIVNLNVQCFNYTVHYRQNDPTWMENVYNDYQRTGVRLKSGMLDHSIGAVGCYITSVANAMNATGTDVTPQQLNDWMKKPNNGFSGHDANANRAFDYPRSHIEAITGWQDVNTADIKAQLSQCNIVFALVKGTTAFTGGHYVLVVKENNGRLMMLDPWKRNTDPDGTFYDYVDNYYTILQYQVLSVKQK